MNALTLLMDDHKTLKRLLSRGEDTTERAVKTRHELLPPGEGGLHRLAEFDARVLFDGVAQHPVGFEDEHVPLMAVGRLQHA